MKNNKLIHYIFTFFGALFCLVSMYELIKFIAPYYSYTKFLLISAIFWVLYLLYIWALSIQNMKKLWSDRWVHQLLSEAPDTPSIRFVKHLAEKKDSIVHGSFIGVFIVAIVSIIWWYETVFSFAAFAFIVVYLLSKILGFRLDTSIQKYSMKDGNALRFFTLVFAIFMICIWAMLWESLIETDKRTLYYALAWLAYIVWTLAVFFQLNLRKVRLFTPYNILSFILISSLVWVLIYKNISGDKNEIESIEEEKEVIAIVEPEPDYIEAIISDEAQLEEVKKAQGEVVKVWEQYELSPGLVVGSSGKNVSNLQEALKKLWASVAISGNYNEETRTWLRDILMQRCDWPESTKWTFGPQAKQCIDNLEITISEEK